MKFVTWLDRSFGLLGSIGFIEFIGLKKAHQPFSQWAFFVNRQSPFEILSP
jgi:hypothetical protein